LWNPTLRYSIQNSPQLVSILSQIHPIHNLPPSFFKIRFNIIRLSTKWSLPLGPSHHNHIRGGTQKFPEMLQKIYLQYLYKFVTLVPFEVLPLRLYAVIPAPLPTEMLSRAASESLAALDSISVEDFRQCFQHWERCWDCCIQSQGDYFEGD